MANPFTKHPQEVGETYVEHFQVAGGFGFTLLIIAFAAMMHAIFPFLFEKTASNKIKALNARMTGRNAQPDCDCVRIWAEL